MNVQSVYESSFQSSLLQSQQGNSSTAFSDILKMFEAGEGNEDAAADKYANVQMDTNQGRSDFDLDEYFSPSEKSGPVNIEDIPLILPTAHNVDTLTKYSEQKFQSLLAQYNIPAAPAQIEFDQEGNLVLPNDYPYAAQLKQALRDNPDTEEALRTTAAVASHYAGILEGQPFRDEMSTARSQADRDRIAAKYSYLFDENRPPKQIVLTFLDDNRLVLAQKRQD